MPPRVEVIERDQAPLGSQHCYRPERGENVLLLQGKSHPQPAKEGGFVRIVRRTPERVAQILFGKIDRQKKQIGRNLLSAFKMRVFSAPGCWYGPPRKRSAAPAIHGAETQTCRILPPGSWTLPVAMAGSYRCFRRYAIFQDMGRIALRRWLKMPDD